MPVSTLSIVAQVLALALIVATLLPFWRSRAGLVRTFDFPRFQIAAAIPPVLVLLIAAGRDPVSLAFVAGLWGLSAADAEPRARRLLEWLDLAPHAHELTEGFSRGMKQKLALAGALIHEPELLILDEPLTGLDAAAARQVKDLLAAHVAGGGTVILTTHILEVAERLAQRIGIIRAGRLVAEGTLDELRARTRQGSLEDVFLQLTERT